MTKKDNKIKCLELHAYSMEQSRIHFYNNANISILEYLNLKELPCELQNAILVKDYKQVIKVIRKILKNKISFKKYVSLSYTSKVYSTYSNTWHDIKEDNYMHGYYYNIKTVLDCYNKIKLRGANEHVKDFKIVCKFS